jgi:hypothetical protein
MLKDWKKNVDMNEKISYENIKTGDEAFITPKNFNYPNKQWTLYIPSRNKNYFDKIEEIDYRGKMEAKRALNAYMRTH